jgi:hypothetical protein
MLKAILEVAEPAFGGRRKGSPFLMTDFSERVPADENKVYEEFFPKACPTRTTFGVALAVSWDKIEIDCHRVCRQVGLVLKATSLQTDEDSEVHLMPSTT